jgi:UDP:flavonoid glycosyltransferase YjiC (YdhE family)
LSRILLCWELGGGYGHLSHLHALAAPLRAMGHECVLALKDLSRAGSLFDPREFVLLQAPVWLPTSMNVPAPLSYADILLHFGYLRPDCLQGLVAAWRGLYATVKPDLLVFNHAPTALLAAHGLSLPRVCIDTGFSAPPQQTPMPALRWWQEAPTRRLHEAEERVLRSVREVADRFGFRAPASVQEMLQTDLRLVCSIPELDHYPERPELPTYMGPVFSLDAPGRADFPLGQGAKVFAYVNQGYGGFAGVIKALADTGCPALVHTPGLSESDHKRLRTASLEFSRAPVAMRGVREQADLVVCHSPGTASAALLAGIPVLLLPTQLEQQMFAKRVEQLGVGLQQPVDKATTPVRPLFKRLLGEDAFRAQARALASRYAQLDSASQAREMAERCVALMAA